MQIEIPIIAQRAGIKGDEWAVRTEEETKFSLDEKIFELYDNGLSIETIAGKVGASLEYINKTLDGVAMESG